MRHGRKAAATWSTATSATCSASLTPAWSVPWGHPANVPETKAPSRSATTWPPSSSPSPSCTSTGPTRPAPWSKTAPRGWRSSARRGGSTTAPVRQVRLHPGLGAPAAGLSRRAADAVCPGRQGPVPHPDLRRLPAAGPVHHQHPRPQRADPPRRAAAGRAAPAAAHPTGGPGCVSGPRSSTAWPTSATGRAAAPATWARARTCSTCAAARWSTTSTSSPAHHGPSSRQPEHHH